MCISQFHVWLSTSGTPNAQPGKLLVLIEVRERQSGFPSACETTWDNVSMEGSIGKPLLNAHRKPPGGLACGSFGLSRGSLLGPTGREM